MEWTWLKTVRWKLTGTTGLGLGSDTSQMRSLPPTWNSLICKEVEAAAAWVSVQPACASASRRRSNPPDAGVDCGLAALAGPADTAAADAAGCTGGEEGRGFGLPLCRAVVRDPAGAFTLTTAERGGWAAPAAAVAVDRCSGTEGGEVFGLPPCRAVARDPGGSFTLATAEGGGRLRASATTLALHGTCLTSEVSSARKDSCR
jgi:hypothetical protein